MFQPSGARLLVFGWGVDGRITPLPGGAGAWNQETWGVGSPACESQAVELLPGLFHDGLARFSIPVPGSASGWRPGQRLGGERSSWPERSKFPDPPAGISSSGPQFIWGPCLRDTLAFQPRALTFDAAVSVSGAEDGTSEPLVVLSLAFSTHLWNSRKMFTMSPS